MNRCKKLYLGIFLIPLVFNPWAYTPFEIPKIAWIFCWVMVALGIFSIQIIRQKVEINWNKKVLIFIGLWLFSLCISTIFSLAPLESFWGTYERMQGLLMWFFYLFHFLICFSFFQKKEWQNSFLKIVEIVGAIVGIHALLQFAKYDFVRLAVDDIFQGRSYATIGQPTMLGQWFIFPLFVAGWNLVKNWKNEKRWQHAFTLICIAGGLLTTVNRATFLAVGITLLFGFFAKYWKQVSFTKKTIIIGIGFSLIALVFVSGSYRSFFSRASIWSHSLPLVTINPVTGIGLEGYYQAFQKQVSPELFETESLYTIPDRAHFELLHIIIEQGILGGVLYFFTFIFGIYQFLKRKENDVTTMALLALTASFISVQFSFMFSAHILFHLTFWALVLQKNFPLKKLTIKVKNLFPRAIVVTTVFTLVFAIFWHAGTLFFSDMQIREAMLSVESDIAKTKNIFDKAIHLNYNRARPLNIAINALAQPEVVLQDPGSKEKLNQYLNRFGEITNKSFEFFILKARIDMANGNYESAKESLLKAQIKAPSSPLVYQTFAENAYFAGHYQEAVYYFEHLNSLAPKYIWNSNDDRARIFYKSNPLFVLALQEYQDAKLKLSQSEN